MIRFVYVVFVILIAACSDPITENPITENPIIENPVIEDSVVENPCEPGLIKTFDRQVRNQKIDIDGDSINDISFPSEIFTSSTGDLVYAEIKTLTDDWLVSTRIKNDTLVIDTLGSVDTINQTSTLRYETRYYREDLHNTWSTIRQTVVPRVVTDSEQENCSELSYSNYALVYYDSNTWAQFASRDFTNPGLDSLYGFLLLKNDTTCYTLEFRSNFVSMHIGDLFQICE